jgi:hypothetical protein
VSVAELFVRSGSVIGLTVMFAVFTTVAGAYPDGTASVSWYDLEAPYAIVAAVVHVNTAAAMAQSASVSDPTVPAGIASVNRTPTGSVEGPLFVIVIV